MRRVTIFAAALAVLEATMAVTVSLTVLGDNAQAQQRRNARPPQQPRVIERDFGPPRQPRVIERDFGPPQPEPRSYYAPAPGIQPPMERVPMPAPLAQPPINR